MTKRAFGAKEVLEALQGFPRDSSPGFTGLRPDHLKDALQPSHRDEVLRLLGEVSELLASGLACDEIRPWITGANLHVLEKKDGGLRPVVVGDHVMVMQQVAHCAKPASTGGSRPFRRGRRAGTCGETVAWEASRPTWGRDGTSGRIECF